MKANPKVYYLVIPFSMPELKMYFWTSTLIVKLGQSIYGMIAFSPDECPSIQRWPKTVSGPCQALIMAITAWFWFGQSIRKYGPEEFIRYSPNLDDNSYQHLLMLEGLLPYLVLILISKSSPNLNLAVDISCFRNCTSFLCIVTYIYGHLFFSMRNKLLELKVTLIVI